MTSLRQRTLWRVFFLLVTGTSLLAYYNYRDSSHEIAEVYDAHLAQNARLLQGVMSLPLAAGDRQKLYGAFDAALLQAGRSGIGHPYENKLAFQVWSADGELLVNTPSAPRIAPQQRTPGFSNVTLDGKQWRGFLLPVSEQQVVIWVGERKDVRGDLVNRIVRHTLLPFLLGGLVLALLVWFAIGWGLQPLQNMANVIRGRHAKSLDPLQLAPLPSELEPMQAAINRLLGQVSDLLRREQRFIADAAPRDAHPAGDPAPACAERGAGPLCGRPRARPGLPDRRRRPLEPRGQPVADPGADRTAPGAAPGR